MKKSTIEFARLLEWLECKLPAEEAQEISRQIETSNKKSQANLDWLKSFQQAGQNIQLDTPPAHVRAALQQRFQVYADSHREPGFFQRLAAILTFDSQAQLVTAGIRSAALEGQQRQLVYETDAAEIVLNLWLSGNNGHMNIAGQVFPLDEKIDPADFIIHLLQGTAEFGLAVTDELGEFSFSEIPSGQYELIAGNDQVEIVVTSVTLQL
jgi:hypothetical protein